MEFNLYLAMQMYIHMYMQQARMQGICVVAKEQKEKKENKKKKTKTKKTTTKKNRCKITKN